MAKSVTHPLNDLQRKLKNLSDGDIESALRTEVEIKKPLLEIEHLAKSTNSIIDKMREYAEILEDQKVELTAQNEELEEKGAHLIAINEQLEFMNVQMKDILDNVGQGFLRFSSDLVIHSGYSKECLDIFNSEIKDLKLSTILFPDDLDQSGFIDELLTNILSDSIVNPNLYIPLLPDEIIFNEKIIQIEYKLSRQSDNKKSMIVILTDITEKRHLESQMDKEQNILKMVVKALTNRSMFIEIAESFESFIEEGKECNWHFTPVLRENRQYIMRQLHTFKGNFSQFDVSELTDALHEAENQVLHMIEVNETDGIGPCFDTDLLTSAYQHDLEIIKTYVGEDYMIKADYFLIEKSRILEIEHKMQSILSEQDCRVLLPEIRSLCHRPVKDLFRMYPEYTLKLAERLDKQIYSFEIETDNLLVDELRFSALAKSMVHVFRNAVDHGIELPDDRVELGKDMMGTIGCTIREIDNQLEIIISDDGYGIDIDSIRQRLPLGEQQLPDEDILLKIFEDDFTTKEAATTLSGRGIGLYAVKREMDLLNGEIIVQSEQGKGTTFIFRVPMTSKDSVIDIIPLRLMNTLAETATNYLKTHVDHNMVLPHLDIMKSKRIELNQLTALVNLKGVINALIMISVNHPLGQRLASSFLIDIREDEDIEQYIEDVLAEVSNTVLGNTLGQLDDNSDFLHMGVPAIISNKGAYVKYTNSEMLSFNFKYDNYEWSVHMIQLENKQIEEENLWQE